MPPRRPEVDRAARRERLRRVEAAILERKLARPRNVGPNHKTGKPTKRERQEARLAEIRRQLRHSAVYTIYRVGNTARPYQRQEGIWLTAEEAQQAAVPGDWIAVSMDPEFLADELTAEQLAHLVKGPMKFAAVYVPVTTTPWSNYRRSGPIWLSRSDAENSAAAQLPGAAVVESRESRCLEDELPLPAIKELKPDVCPAGCAPGACGHYLQGVNPPTEALTAAAQQLA